MGRAGWEVLRFAWSRISRPNLSPWSPDLRHRALATALRALFAAHHEFVQDPVVPTGEEHGVVSWASELERGGDAGGLVFFGAHSPVARLYEIVDEGLNVVSNATIDSLIADFEANTGGQ